jgi:hypothetical protein
MYLGSGIWKNPIPDPESRVKKAQDQGSRVRKTPDPGSGFAALDKIIG